MDENILRYFELAAISAGDYRAVLRQCVNAGVIGGMVYDALHLKSAERAGCERVYTFNVKDFRALAPDSLVDRIAAP